MAIALDNLIASLFVRETVLATPIEQYTYELTADGRDLAAKVVEESPAEHDTVRSIVDACKRRCLLRAPPMSCAAKVHFMLEADPGCAASAQGIRGMARDFGWNMTGKEIDDGMALLEDIAPPRIAAR